MDDLKGIISSLESIKDKAAKLKNNKELATIIDSIGDLSDDAAGFGGDIARVLPLQLKVQIDALTGIYNQMNQTAKAASDAVDGLLEYLDNIPYGQLRKKSRTHLADENEEAQEQQIDVTPDTSAGPASHVAESKLTDFFKKNFSEDTKRQACSSFSIEALKESGIIEEKDEDIFGREFYKLTEDDIEDDNNAIKQFQEMGRMRANDSSNRLRESAPVQAMDWRSVASQNNNLAQDFSRLV